MDQLFSNPEGPARSNNSGRVIEAVPEDDPVLALRAREERKRNTEVGEWRDEDEQKLVEAYGKGSEELADEAEEGYDVSKMVARQDDIIDAEVIEEAELDKLAQETVDAQVAEAKKKAAAKKRKDVKSVEKLSPEQLMAEVGVEPIYSTTEAAEFFDRSNQWLYWGLREGVFLDDDGEVIDPDRVGDPKTGRRRFTLTIVKQILLSSYRRGNIEPDEMTKILRRIKIAKVGGEWREAEGWHKVQISKNKQRWVHPDKCEKVGGKWQLRQDAELEPE